MRKKIITEMERMQQLSGIKEYFGGSESDRMEQQGMELSTQQKQFVNFAMNYHFKHTINTVDVKNRKFLGITISKEMYPTTKEIYYNDFSFYIINDDELKWQSGANGSFRPENHFIGDASSDKSISNRMQKIVDLYNQKNGTNVELSGDSIIL